CGRLAETQLYNNKPFTEQDEHPWLGRIIYRFVNGSSTYRCAAVLLDSRNVLAPALCLKGKAIQEHTPDAVTFETPECLSAGSVPRAFEIERIFVPPEYNETAYQNDLAVIRLAEEVPFSKTVQPICLPQSAENSRALAGMNLELIGHELGNYRPDSLRVKTHAHMLDQTLCQKLYQQISPQQICGYVSGSPLQAGSILVGVRLIDGEPVQYYLIGHLLAGYNEIVDGADLFMYIAPYKDWIEKIMK
ncbi:hypothetical protein KR059_000291, partial [Drosophila kikkawai]